MNHFRFNNLTLKYHTLGCKDIEMSKFEFVELLDSFQSISAECTRIGQVVRTVHSPLNTTYVFGQCTENYRRIHQTLSR